MTRENTFALPATARKSLMPLALSFGLAGAIATPAMADTPLFRNIEIGGGFNVATVYVDQQDGKWDRLNSAGAEIPVHRKIEMSRGYIVFYRVGRTLTNGAVRESYIASNKYPGYVIPGRDNKVDAATSVERTTNIFINNSTLNPIDRQAIINRCNAKWTETEQGHSFQYSLPLAIHADARRHRRPNLDANRQGSYKGYGDFARATATGFVGIKVVCTGTDSKYSRNGSQTSKLPSDGGIPLPSNADTAVNKDPIEVKMNLDVAGGNACPRNVKVTTRIIYDHPKTAKFDIVRNGKVLKTVEIKARREALSHGPDQWVIDRIDTVEAKAGQNQFRILVKGGGKSSMKVANIECAPFEVLFSDLTYNVADGGVCPKKVWETTTFSASGPGRATMQLVQENGSVFYEKELETILKNGKYKLVNQRVLSIDRDTDKKFRAQIKGQSGIHSKWAQLKVSCPKRTNPKPVNTKEGPKKLNAEPKRNDAATTKPVRSDAKPQIVCTGGKISNGNCKCGKSKIRKEVGKRNYQCVTVAKALNENKAVRTTPKEKKQALVCKGGKISNGNCKCGKSKIRKEVGKRNYQCVAVVKAPNNNKAVRTNPKEKKAGLVCKGGNVKGGKCRCGKDKVAKKQGNRQFVCVAKRG